MIDMGADINQLRTHIREWGMPPGPSRIQRSFGWGYSRAKRTLDAIQKDPLPNKRGLICSRCHNADQICPECGSATVSGSRILSTFDIDEEPFCCRGECDYNVYTDEEQPEINLLGAVSVVILWCPKCEKVIKVWANSE